MTSMTSILGGGKFEDKNVIEHPGELYFGSTTNEELMDTPPFKVVDINERLGRRKLQKKVIVQKKFNVEVQKENLCN